MRSLRFYFTLLVVAACSDSNGLPDPTFTNVEESVTLYALVGTPVATPSGYALEGPGLVRTDITDAFDFAYNIEPDGRPVFVPRAALGIEPEATANPGLQLRNESFEAITVAPNDGYVTDRVVPIAAGERYVVRGRVTCSIGVPKYAKLEILTLDSNTRTVTFRIITNDNCGFKGLEPGLPDR